jgi:hypothetical protein
MLSIYNKAWREANKEKIKAYRGANKEKLQQKINCGCGGKHTHANEVKHFKTMRHQKWLQEQLSK